MAKGGGKRRETADLAKFDRLAIMLAQGVSQTEASRQTAIPLRTIQRRAADPDFRAIINGHRKRLIDEAFGTLANVATPAIRELNQLLRDVDPSIRLQSAKALGALLVKFGSYHALTERMDAIEANLAERGAK